MASLWRFVVPLVVGCVVGAAVAVAVNVPVDHLGRWPRDPREYFGPWGIFFGAFAAALAFGIALAVIRGEIAPRRAARRHPLATSLIAAALVGLFVMAALNIPLYNAGRWPDHGRELLGFWGELAGLGAAVITFLFAQRRLLRKVSSSDLPHVRPRRKMGLLISAAVTGLFGLVVTWHNVAWGVPLLSLEGAWLWPLAIGPLLLSLTLLRSYVRHARSLKNKRATT